ncbi:hypothetical protein [Flavobacterium sp.]|uniref:hypothetical protein n=1 Tax=Flavobacterium sp. TaxID=239 RepID=UPI0037537297
MRNRILLIMLMLMNITYSQNTNTSLGNVSMPNFTPPSPSAFEFTKYGDIPVNEFSGMINTSIPLYEYKAGNLTMSISLNYASSGVKVDQSATWTGINWVLRTGGLITRTINDLADEIPSQRIILNSVPLNSGADGSPEAIYITGILNSVMIFDTEADIFNFNFNGYSGSFFLDNNLVPTLVKNDSELKIEIVGTLSQSQAFIITSPDGVKYYFGGSNAIEFETGTSQTPCSSCGSATAYHLTKMEHPINGTILFDYETISGSAALIAKSQNYGIMTECTMGEINECTPFPPPPETYPEKTIITYTGAIRILKKIHSPSYNFFIEFITQNTNLANAQRILSKINIKKFVSETESVLIKDILLEYINSNSTNSKERFFLSKVSVSKDIAIQNNLNNKYDEYSFIYEDPLGLPDRLTYGQDYYGYFNGVTNNISSLPELNFHPFNSANYNFSAANRRVNFNYAIKGTLVKIIYPTKGYTEFEYEGTPVKEKSYTRYQGNASLSSTGANLSNNQVPRYDTELETQINFPPVFETQTVTIALNLSTDSECYENYHNKRVRLIITDVTPITLGTLPLPPTIFLQSLGMTTGNTVFKSFTFVQNRQYTVKVEFLNESVSCSSPFNTSFNFQLYSGYTIKDGKGIRIKKVTSRPSENETSSIKRFYYVPAQKVATYLNHENVSYEHIPRLLSYGMLNFRGKHKSGLGPVETQVCVWNFYTYQAYYTYINSNAVQNCFNVDDNQEVYKVVTISYGGDNFENGGTQKIFNRYSSDFGSIVTPLTLPQFETEFYRNRFYNKLNNNGTLSGEISQQIDFEKRNNTLYKKSQKDYFYDNPNENINKFYINLVGKEVYSQMEFQPGTDEGTISSNYFIKSFLTTSYNTKLKSVNEATYFSDCLVPEITNYNVFEVDTAFEQIPDDLSVKKLTTTQTYTYNNYRGLPTEVTTTTSNSGEINTTKNYYVNQNADMTGLTNAHVFAFAKLIAQNNVASPIQVEQYKNGDLLSTQRTLFKTWNNNPEMVLPEIIQTSKSDQPLEDRVLFTEYDAKGNPLVVSLKNGTKTKYFYNTNNQVIIKVENYTASLNMPDVPTYTDHNAFQALYPTTMISIYNYDAITNQIKTIIAPNGNRTFYEYDALHKLKYIRDKNQNIIQEFDQNYKPLIQN